MIPVAFAAPLALLGLLALPLVWLVLRATPPRPRIAVFPPLRILLGLEKPRETPARTPWPLLVLRLLMAALAALAFAGPIWNPPAATRGAGPTIVAMDDGWGAAASWNERRAFAQKLEAAGREGRPVALAPLSAPITPVFVDSARALEALRALKPQAYAPDRRAATPALTKWLTDAPAARLVWIADGLETGGARAFAESLAAVAPDRVAIARAEPRQLFLRNPVNAATELTVEVARLSAQAQQRGRLRAFDAKGAEIAAADFDFANALQTRATLTAPVELRNAMTALRIDGERSAGALSLLDDGDRRRIIGLVSGATVDVAQPLLAPNYYLNKALGPWAQVREARANADDPIAELIDDGANVLILSDVSIGEGATRERLDDFLERGGLVIRFAGPRLAAAEADDLTPVRLRRGGRTLGGALSWETPKNLAPFERSSPFFGLPATADVTVSRQVLAEPEPGLSERTWAQLSDQTPVVTAERRGKGLLVLFHVTADTAWSNLPLSGLFPDLLQKIVALSARPQPASATGPAAEAAPNSVPHADGPRPAYRLIDGFGEWRAPGGAQPLTPGTPLRASAATPPGLYGDAESATAINAIAPDETVTAADLAGLPLRTLALEAPASRDLRGPLLIALALLMLVDMAAALAYSGLRWPRRSGARTAAFLGLLAAGAALAGAMHPAPAQAQNAPAATAAKPAPRLEPSKRDMDSALTTRLAYVVTGDARLDEASKRGLQELSRVLNRRTSLAPGEPVGLDPARDELAFYPLLYWPIAPAQPQPETRAVQKIAGYMKQGGFVIFDTRDALTARPGGAPSPERLWLRKLFEGIDAPELEIVPADHVVTKTFYLLDTLVGRYAARETWIEALPPPAAGAERPARAGDSVSPLIVTPNDLAGAWATGAYGAPLYPLGEGGARQRELALRTGVNLVMYTLTGNYKADQVHVRDLLNRLGH